MAAPELEALDQKVRRLALALGFDIVGIARAERLGVEHERYARFVERGMHGRMDYLAENVDVRREIDGEGVLLGAKSIVCVGMRYARSAESEAADPPLARTIARYARGRDYHMQVRRRLRRLSKSLRELGPGVMARPICDIEPVMERVWAARAGLGFVGKNGLVITPGRGSYQLLGEVVTTLELVPDTPMAERCGSCTRCLDACPTGAFEAPFVLDPRRCIAYLTIESPDAPPEELRSAVGEHLFGCDVCQEVCPFNRAEPEPPRTSAFNPHERWGRLGLDDLVRLDEPGWASVGEATPIRRATRAGLARNAALVAANRLARKDLGEADPDGFADARRALEAAEHHDDPRVREVAEWGLRERAGDPGEPGAKKGPYDDGAST